MWYWKNHVTVRASLPVIAFKAYIEQGELVGIRAVVVEGVRVVGA